MTFGSNTCDQVFHVFFLGPHHCWWGGGAGTGPNAVFHVVFGRIWPSNRLPSPFVIGVPVWEIMYPPLLIDFNAKHDEIIFLFCLEV